MPKAKYELHWRCEICHTGGSAKGTSNTRADKALDSMLAHHRELSAKAGVENCKANFLAIPYGYRNYWLLTMKSEDNVDVVGATKPTSAGVITAGMIKDEKTNA